MRKTTEQMILEQTRKYEELAQLHQQMKEVNLYYRRNLVMAGCPHPEIVPYWKYEKGYLHPANWCPFSRLEMQNNFQKMQRIKERLAFLRERAAAEKEAQRSEEPETGKELFAEKEMRKADVRKDGERPSVREKLRRNREILKTTDRAAEEVAVYGVNGAAKAAPER